MMETPKIFDKKPSVLELEAGQYYWCACGLSAKNPFCDGSHKTTEFVPLKFELVKKQKIALCLCKFTANPPKCDGTHKNL